jgi:NitT/TauT family transport system substrate-binding protein
LAIAHGAPFRIIAGAGMYASKSPTTVLMVAKGSPLANPAELAGKTIAVTALKDLTEVGVRAWLERNGIDARAVHFAEIPMPQMPAALARGTVDAAVIGEPWITSSRDSLRTFATFYDAIAPRFLIADWFANTTFIAKNPSVVGRFVEAVNETARWANAHRAESAAILAKWVKLDPSFVASMGRCEYATSLESSELDPVLAAMATYQVLDRRVHIDDVAWRGRP